MNQDKSEALKLVEFSEPKCHHTSIAILSNEHHQQLRFEVKSLDETLVRRYIETLRATFVILPGDAFPTLEEHTVVSSKAPPDPSEVKNLQSVEEHLPDHGMEIRLEVIETNGIQPPYYLNLTLDPYIAQWNWHCYRTYNVAKSFMVTVTATGGEVGAILRKEGCDQSVKWEDGGIVDLNVNTTYSSSTSLHGSSDDESVKYGLKLIGCKDNNSYMLDISMEIVY